MDKVLLKVLLWFIKLFKNKDVDFEKLKIITETKLMMDRRRSPATWKKRQQKEMKNPLLFTQIMYFFLGLLVGSLIFAVPLITGMIIIHAYLLFMMAMTLVTDFSSVLLDTTDNQIILPRPISSRTLFLSRVIHILVYLLQFMIAIIGSPLIFIFIKYGVFTGLTGIATVTLTVAFAVFITYLLYALILRFADEQKVKDIIGYFQVFMTVFFVAAYQVVPRLIDLKGLNFSVQLHWYSYFLPPVWMAEVLEAVNEFNFDNIHVLMIALAVLVPILTVWFMIRFLAPSFSRKLAALNNTVETTKKTNVVATRKQSDTAKKLSAIICKTKTESAGFEKVWKITARDKSFKVQFYPGFAYILVFAFVFVFKSGKDFSQVWAHLPSSKIFLAFIYLPLMGISSGLNIIPFNENFAAAWIYQAVPLAKPGEIISGTIKAILLKFFVPIYLIFFSFALYIWGTAIIDDFIFGFFNNMLIFMIMANLIDHYLPFSQQANIKMQSGKFLRIIIQLILVGLLIGLHYLALRIFWLPSALIPASVIGAYLLLKRIQNLSWLKISV
ncbi:MAG: hypothetical protein QM737_03355 [Ferruginibacter sp.]